MDNISNIAQILLSLRTQQGIKQEELCRGLCHRATYSRFEKGERIPDWLIFNALLQRMGRDAGKISPIVNDTEYAYFLWRRSAAEAAVSKDRKALETLLQLPEAMVLPQKGCESLQYQFLYYMKALLAEQTGSPLQDVISWLRKAVEATLPGFCPEEMESRLISLSEMDVLIELAWMLIRVGEKEEALILLTAIIPYVQHHYKDREARLKTIPKATRLLAPILLERKRYTHCMALCSDAVDLLCSRGVLFDLPQLMEIYLKADASVNDHPTEVAIRYEKQLTALLAVSEEYGVDLYQTHSTAFSYQNQDMYLMGEVIRTSRRFHGLSQESASEGICSPEHFSRIENGKKVPNRKTFHAILDKLNADMDYFETDLFTSEFQILEWKREYDLALSRNDLRAARNLLFRIQDGLQREGTLDHTGNQQILMVEDGILRYYEDDLDEALFMRQCADILGCEPEDWLTEDFWNQFITNFKVHILNMMAVLYAICRREYDKGIYIWEHILNWMKNSKIPMEARFSASMVAISNLSAFYGTTEKHEQCIEICEEGILLALTSGRGMELGKYVMNKTESRMDLGIEQETNARVHIQYAYYLDDLFGMKKSMKYEDNYYRQHFDSDVVWY